MAGWFTGRSAGRLGLAQWVSGAGGRVAGVVGQLAQVGWIGCWVTGWLGQGRLTGWLPAARGLAGLLGGGLRTAGRLGLDWLDGLPARAQRLVGIGLGDWMACWGGGWKTGWQVGWLNGWQSGCL